MTQTPIKGENWEVVYLNHSNMEIRLLVDCVDMDKEDKETVEPYLQSVGCIVLKYLTKEGFIAESDKLWKINFNCNFLTL